MPVYNIIMLVFWVFYICWKVFIKITAITRAALPYVTDVIFHYTTALMFKVSDCISEP